ncbi:MAG: glycosyltransferase family 4 protein [Bacilli bacterium]|nr:glycosyltransferase family 4 protein [Bacilli bacterium]
MEKKILNIRMLSSATSVDGQGVGSAYLEQVALVKEQKDLYRVYINKEKAPKGEKNDIVHVHTVNPGWRRRMGKKTVNVIYVHFIPTTLDGSVKLPKPIFAIFKKYVVSTYRKADEIVVVNPTFIKPLVELGCKEENITFIPNYVSKEEFHLLAEKDRLALREKYNIPKDRFVVLGCGQVQTRKGVLDYVECAKRLPDIEFVWAGGFSFGAITDGYAELKKTMENPPSNVHFLGIVPRKEMNGIFNMGDMLFMPSLSELMPMSILEAANSNKPVLLRDLDIYPDIFFDDYAKASDVDGFVKQIEALAKDRDFYKTYSEKAMHLSEYYSKERVGECWREYYPRIYKKWSVKKKLH